MAKQEKVEPLVHGSAPKVAPREIRDNDLKRRKN